MIGSIIGDIIGSEYEFNATKDYDFPLFVDDSDFTDDTVLTIAVADALLNNKSFGETIHKWGNNYPRRGYGGRFKQWLARNNPEPYNSFGNGSAMRVSSVGLVGSSLHAVLSIAKQTAEVSHNHPEGIKGAQAVAMAIHLACIGRDKAFIKKEIETNFNYNLSLSYSEVQKVCSFNETCQVSVPEALISFLESTDYESAIRLAVTLGGDADTQACIAGGIAEAYYKKIPQQFIDKAFAILPDEMTIIINELYKRFPLKKSSFGDRMQSSGW